MHVPMAVTTHQTTTVEEDGELDEFEEGGGEAEPASEPEPQERARVGGPGEG
jgi:hypothetical protein